MTPAVSRRIAVIVLLLALLISAGWIFLRRTVAEKPAPVPVAVTPPPSVPVSPGATAPAPADHAADVRAALDAARSLRQPDQRAREFGRVLLEWIGRDPEAALAYVRSLSPGADRTQGLLMVLASIGRQDPDRALVLARELAVTRELRAIYSSLFAQMVAADPAGALPRLALVPAGEGRDNALRALADGWARKDLPAALTWAQGLDPADRSPAMESVLGAMLPEDPLRAVELAQQTLTGAALDRTLIAAVQSLVRIDPKAAAALVSLLAPGEVQTAAALAVARALAAQDPGAALAWSKTLPEDQAQPLAFHNILEVWAAKDPAAAGRYVAQMEPGPAQDAAAVQLARLLAAVNPTDAIAWAQSLASESARHPALVSLVSVWAQNDPAAAARWAGSLAAPDLSAEALKGALSYWMLQDSRAAQEFVLTLSGDRQAGAAASIAPGLAQRDPLAAIAWTQTLPLAEARDAALVAAYGRWSTNAPAAARSWLANANLPAELKARLAGSPSH